MIHQGGFTHLLGPPAAAVDSLVADVLHVKTVHYFRAVFVDWHVHSALGTALWTQVACQQVGAQSRGHCNRNDGGQLICKCTHEGALVFERAWRLPAHSSTYSLWTLNIFKLNFGCYDLQAEHYKIWFFFFFWILFLTFHFFLDSVFFSGFSFKLNISNRKACLINWI